MNWPSKGSVAEGSSVGPAGSSRSGRVARAGERGAHLVQRHRAEVGDRRPVELPLRTSLHWVGARPTPYSSFQLKAPPPIDSRASARPVIVAVAPVTGAYQSGESIEASGGILPCAARRTASPTLARP